MTEKVRHYADDRIDVSYNTQRCIHAAECVRGLPAVFDTKRRPWILPAAADADAIAEVIARCPSGALHFTRHDGGPAEPLPEVNTIAPTPNGPLYVRGRVQLRAADGSPIVEDVRMALCRCGQSHNKPFCDNSHRDAGFSDAGVVTDGGATSEAGDGLTITASENGPYLVKGPLTLCGAGGQSEFHADSARLCRCGGSGNKPFCDGTHRRNGFRSGEAGDEQ